MNVDLRLGDCLHVIREMPDESIDAIVTDPPYGLFFMGKRWDYDVPSVEIWAECLRVLKPGGHLLSFAGTRTQHRMAVRIEDAGFEIRDMIAWVYGSGFPKSHSVAKAIEAGGGRPEDIRRMAMGDAYTPSGRGRVNYDHGAASAMNGSTTEWLPSSPEAAAWSGWGTALKPALEPITLARKPLAGTVAQNVIAHGVGAINVDGCRVAVSDPDYARNCSCDRGHDGTRPKDQVGATDIRSGGGSAASGRWPANLIHDGSQEVLAAFPEAPGAQAPVRGTEPTGHGFSGNVYGAPGTQGRKPIDRRDGGGSAARFFYCAKASKSDRDIGLAGFDRRASAASEFRPNHAERAAEGEDGNPYGRWSPQKNHHPTVKPTALMRYLCRLVTPPGGVILDPFMGSGSTGRGAILEGFGFIGIEREAEFFEIAQARIASAQRGDPDPEVFEDEAEGDSEDARRAAQLDIFSWMESNA